MHFEQPEGRTIGIVRLEHRLRHVEHGNPRLGFSLGRTLVRMAVEHGRHIEARQRVLESARAEEGKDLRRLALDRSANRGSSA